MNIVEFTSQGTTLRAGHYPALGRSLANAAGLPCIVMAHGLGGTRSSGLEPYARHFAAQGLTVLCFDYRGFGASDGQPRQVLDVRAQLDDWAAAIAYARNMAGIDATRIALWGSSFSGGHVVAAAVEDGEIAAISSQGAMMDGLKAGLNIVRYAGAPYFAKLCALAAKDLAAMLLGRPRVMAPIVCEPGELGMVSSVGSKAGYYAITPPEWRNEGTLAWLLTLPLYRPVAMASQLTCPALFCICTQDNVCPPSAVEQAARNAGELATVKRYPLGHFDIYVGQGFAQSSADQAAFFMRVLAE